MHHHGLGQKVQLGNFELYGIRSKSCAKAFSFHSRPFLTQSYYFWQRYGALIVLEELRFQRIQSFEKMLHYS